MDRNPVIMKTHIKTEEILHQIPEEGSENSDGTKKNKKKKN